MAGIIELIKNLFPSSDTTASEQTDSRADSQDTVDPEVIINGAEAEQGVATLSEELRNWQSTYTEDYADFLTVEEALQTYQRAQAGLKRLSPILENPDQFSTDSVEAAETLRTEIRQVCEFIEARESYNTEWIEVMKASHGDELNSYFYDESLTHTDQQFRAIFSNDNFNRVNAAAGTGKTTTFGRRVNFILSEYDDVAASDLLAITFTRNGVSEMQQELRETFDITGVEVSTINSYSKSVAEDQYSDLEFVVGEAKTTEIAAIWREIRNDEEYKGTFESFIKAWKDSQYDPNDYDVVKGVYEGFTEKSGVTVGGEEVQMDRIPEEGLAHEAIARFLMEHQIEYDYQVHLEWAHSASGGYVLDFRLVDSANDETIYIEYCTSETTRQERPPYRNSNSERPETVHRIFEPNENLDTDPSDKTGIVIDGEEVLDESSDTIAWDNPATQEQFKTAVTETLKKEFAATPFDLGSQLTGEEFVDYVYDHKILTRDIVDNIAEFISQARVREWEPEQASTEVRKYIKASDEIDDGVEEFCELCLAAYAEFTEVFDNRTKTDFHGSIVLTRDLLEAGKVDDQFLYQYIFIDEMQDLNQVQFGVVKALAEQLDDMRIFGVGDDWQSIFGFQGARPDLFINYGDVLGAGNCEDLPDPVSVFTDDNPILADYDGFVDTRLEDNFRCPDTVVAASNAVIRNNEIRTDKNPTGLEGGDPINVHHLGCDTNEYRRNISMQRKIEELIHTSAYPPEDIQILLRQQDGDPEFYYGLKKVVPDTVDIRTAHDSKGSEAEHVIIPKVSKVGGYPSMKPDPWLEPIKQPPEIYEEEDVTYQLEEERRLFYVALTRAESRLDVLTVQGAESVFVEELPDQLCNHLQPLAEDELTEIETENECRKVVSGSINAKFTDNFAVVDWDGGGLVGLNMYDASDEQRRQIDKLDSSGAKLTLQNCGIEFRDPLNENDADYEQLQLQLDSDVTIQM
ncbi:UvrD-helicase domain-containing protein [Haloarcula amylolytica]|uniref:UvrD-helicase domain-containing protein n=1 Tax=Haloarcula amylolytica TaxID=396317 RepID=UPI003C71BC95